MSVHRVRSILLLGAYFFAINEIRVSAWNHVCRQNVSASWHRACLTFLEAHRHWRHDPVGVVVHFENFLLLSRQVLRLALTINHCETHGTGHKYVVIGAIGSLTIWRLHKIVVVGTSTLDRRKVLVLRILATVVGDIPSVLALYASFLVVAVQVLDVQRPSSLVGAQLSCRSWLQGLVLGTCSALSMQMLSQVTVW
jgi:hypothetical protein